MFLANGPILATRGADLGNALAASGENLRPGQPSSTPQQGSGATVHRSVPSQQPVTSLPQLSKTPSAGSLSKSPGSTKRLNSDQTAVDYEKISKLLSQLSRYRNTINIGSRPFRFHLKPVLSLYVSVEYVSHN